MLLPIDIDELQKACEDTERTAFDYFLDTSTGEVIILSIELIDLAHEILSKGYDDDIEEFEDVEPDEIPEVDDWIEDEVELALSIFLDSQSRYVRIPERDRTAAFSAMRNFAETLQDRDLAERLLTALEGTGSFRKFKDILGPYPRERKLWYSHNARTARHEIKTWLLSIGISPARD